MSMEDEPTQLGTPDSPRAPSYWNSPVSENNSAPMPPPRQKRKTPLGVVTALIAVVAVLSVALVILIMQRGSSGPIAASTKTSAQLTQENSSSRSVNSASALNTSSSTAQAPTSAPVRAADTASSNPASTSDVTAAFPDGSRSVCGSDTNDTDTQIFPLTNLRVRIGSKIANSCGFVAEVANDVDEQVAANPSISSFPLAVQTPRDKSWKNLQCSRVNHLSTCVINGEPEHVIYVRDK